ncbi:MAG: hypothetical protein HY736_21120 [Verrucomicrobia bacterium]|nr:hypothetical protein [Verrucomicrobiota bacterium]
MTTLLAQHIEKIIALIEEVGDAHWTTWLKQDAADLRAGDQRGVRHFLSAFGGMGSLNDLIICPENRHRVKKEEVDAVNRKLTAMLEDAWNLARTLAGDTAR